MPPSCPFFKWFLLAATLVSYAASTLASAQSQPTKPDPLAPLLSVVNEDDDEVRLSVSLLKVPVIDFAKALHEQGAATGGMNKEWQAQLEQWRAAGRLELVAATGASILPDGSFDWGGTITPHRFVTQNSAAMFWDELQWRTEPGFDPSTWENLLERLGEEPRGTRCKGSLTLTRDPAVAVLNMDFAHTPAPETRPTTTWPQPYFPTPRVFFRPWQVATRGAVPVNKVFLLGAQMEAPHDGEMNTGHILLAAARITRGAKVKDGGTPAPSRSFELQSWSLSVPAPAFLSWLAERKPMIDDGKALDGWLATMGKADCATLLGAASMKLSPRDKSDSSYDTQSFVKSALKWEDATGFEPSGNNNAFRPRVPECDTYHLTHSLQVSLSTKTGTDAESATPEMELSLELERPPGPARWKKWKRAMELDENDPGAVELAEVNYHQDAPEALANQVKIVPGKVLMVGAAMKGAQVHVHFVRLTETSKLGLAAPRARELNPAPADPMTLVMATTTVWQIETSGTWLGRVLDGVTASPISQSESLASELLKATLGGRARVVALSSRSQSSSQRSQQSLSVPVSYFGGEYVNTAPHAQGLYFNTRHHGLERAGERDEWDVFATAAGHLGDLQLEQHTTGTPEWRHWGIWQPGVKKTTSENSGIPQPVFPVADFWAGVTLPLGTPRVLGVYQISQMGAVKVAQEAPTLRWIVARMETEGEPLPRQKVTATETDTSSQRRLSTLQAVVLHADADMTIPSDSDALASKLLSECAKGARSPLDAFCILDHHLEGSACALTTGHNFHSTRGGEIRSKEEYDNRQKTPAQLPANTPYDDQIMLDQRIVGVTFSVGDGNWQMERDLKAPQVVTDTFQGVRYEFPQSLIMDDSPKRTSVSVQRAVFDYGKHEGKLPDWGKGSVTRLTPETVLVLRLVK